MKVWYITYRVCGEIFGVQTNNVTLALAAIKSYACFNEICSVEETNHFSLAASDLMF